MRTILGTQSAARRLLFARLAPVFETLSADIDEQAIRSDDPLLLPLLLARAKVDALVPRVGGDALLVTFDQVVTCGGELREKPASSDQARVWLESCAAHPAQTNTAVVVHNTATGARAEGLDVARVYFRPIPKEIIALLIQEGGVLRAAGGFLVEDSRFQPFIDRIEGETESVMGLPIALTSRLMRQCA